MTQREQRRNYWKAVPGTLWLIVALAMLLRGSWLLTVELQYLAWGKVAQAEVLSAEEIWDDGDDDLPDSPRTISIPLYDPHRLVVEYRFTEKSSTTPRTGTADVPHWRFAERVNTQATVQFLPGRNNRSRLKGDTSWLPCLGWTAVGALLVCGPGRPSRIRWELRPRGDAQFQGSKRGKRWQQWKKRQHKS
jgi:hypothetical protein